MKNALTLVLGFVASTIMAFVTAAEMDSYGQLYSVMQQEAEDKALPMLSLILVDGQGVVWSAGVGESQHRRDLVADADTVYRIGSVSKLFTDIAVMQYVEQGLLDLDKPVSTYLPDFKPTNPFSKPITLRSLMSHSSGLVREPPVGNYFDPTEPTLAATVNSLNQTTLIYQPGTKVQYSNAGIAVVGRVLELLSGQDFAALLDERLLQPMGMQNSAFAPKASLSSRLPEAYMWSYHDDRSVAPTFELGTPPAGSMYSTMNDLALFMNTLIDQGRAARGRVLRPKTLHRMWGKQSPDSQTSARNRSFGIGFILGELDGEFSVSHGGAIYGFSSQLKVLPERKIGVAVSTNLDMSNGTTSRLGDYALRYLVAVQEGKPLPTYQPSLGVAEAQADKLLGYYSDGKNTIELKRKSGDLYLERVKGLSLRIRELAGKLVVDDVVRYTEDFSATPSRVQIFGDTYQRVAGQKPKQVKTAWQNLIGEYGYDHNILYISEKFGKLHALIEWGLEYPLIEVDSHRFRFPDYGLYPNEELVFEPGSEGRIANVSLNDIKFVRRSVGSVDGGFFQITPVKPVAELEKVAQAAHSPAESGSFKAPDLVDITHYSDSIKLDIRYASDNNFLGTPIYSSARAFLQRPAAEALVRVTKRLEQEGYGLLVHDGYRPWYVSKIFWDATPQESKIFVADPSKGSRHNRGCAIDLTLYDLKSGQPVDMVGLYDEMTDRSFPHYPGGTSLQRWHRELLRSAMEAEGYTVYEYEWWHFDFDGWENYQILTDTFESLN